MLVLIAGPALTSPLLFLAMVISQVLMNFLLFLSLSFASATLNCLLLKPACSTTDFMRNVMVHVGSINVFHLNSVACFFPCLFCDAVV